ncbi:hypothetical protein KKG81_12025 [bacterium]|jgi:hypothetical protein|nr:hypothetical protein [bacterium]
MISLSRKKVSIIGKLTLTILVVYSLGFVAYRAITFYKIYFEKETLTEQLQVKRNETNSLKRQVELSKKKIEDTEKLYISKEELETKVKDIFGRMSILDYNLKYIDSKKMCLDRYIIISQVSAQSDDGLKAAEGILAYIGSVKKSEKNDTIYFVDYITKEKEIKK